MIQDETEEPFEEQPIEMGYEPSGIIVFSDTTGLIALFNSCFEAAGAAQRKKKIESLLAGN